MKKHANLSIFVPHAGCTHQCSFCDQRTISQTQKVPSPQDVQLFCQKYLPQDSANTEIAFFGGSFTAIHKDIRLPLLAAAYEFVKQGKAKGIRLSTRPDAIDEDILAELAQYGVTSIELGAQSMDDKVLELNQRGHTAAQVVSAAQLIKEKNFSLGLQMMPGLYGAADYYGESMDTMKSLLSLAPDTMRIYPAVVINNTVLGDLYKNGQYTPLDIKQAVKICADLIIMCEETNVKVIRVGLAADAQLEKQVLAGPYHAAFKELCESEIFYNLFLDKLLKMPQASYTINVSPKAQSAAIGQKKSNIQRLLQSGYDVKINALQTLCHREFNLG